MQTFFKMNFNIYVFAHIFHKGAIMVGSGLGLGTQGGDYGGEGGAGFGLPEGGCFD